MIQLIIDGLFVGSFYALVALGYSMVYGIIKLLNFAHGDVYMVGAFAGLTIFSAFSGLAGGGILSILLVMLLAMIFTGILGVTIERVAYRPLRSSPRLAVLITAVGMSFILEYGVRQIFGPDPKVYPTRLEGETLDLLGGRITMPQIVMMLVAAALMFGLNTYIMRSRDGRATVVPCEPSRSTRRPRSSWASTSTRSSRAPSSSAPPSPVPPASWLAPTTERSTSSPASSSG